MHSTIFYSKDDVDSDSVEDDDLHKVVTLLTIPYWLV